MKRNFAFSIGDGLELALFDLRHADELFLLTHRNRSHLYEWLTWVDDIRTADDTRAWIKKALQQFADNDGFQLGIWADGVLVGCIGYHFWDWPDRKTEIGYWLGADYQGRGIITRACAALVTFAFQELGLNRVEIQCATDNARSRAVPERLGFSLDGILRHDVWARGRPIDHAVYSILRDEWHPEANR